MDIQNFIDGIQELLRLMFGGQPPEWLLPVIAWILALGLLIWSITFLFVYAKKLWIEFIHPIFYNFTEKSRRVYRQRFAEHIQSEIKRLNRLEFWHEYRFTELEAEVEIEGQILLFGQFNLPWFNSHGLRHVKSLSKALQKSHERLILLEGDPGSGKSIALRHIALQLGAKACKSRSLKSVIPLYVNLKNLQRNNNEAIDRNLIETFILKTVNRINDRDIDEFLENEFKQGLRNGTWLFLFDSFDEIPEILNSTDTDNTVKKYAEAIRDFLHGMNKCRGILASREYHGPRILGWSQFRILPLTYSQCVRLIKLTNLPRQSTQQLIGEFTQITTDFSSVASNPLFLALLCDYIQHSNDKPIPHHTYEVFREYFNKRLSKDSDRIQKQFGITLSEINSGIEKIAFCMTAESGIGLNPTREQLYQAISKQNFNLSEDSINRLLDSLEFLKLARQEKEISSDEPWRFAFAHRRFQEYFTTSYILHNVHKISPKQLLTNASWRETTVVLLQTQNPDSLQPLLTEVENELKTMLESVCLSINNNTLSTVVEKNESDIHPNAIVSFIQNLINVLIENIFKFMGSDFTTSSSHVQAEKKINIPFPWPQGALHLLAILQDGLGGTQQIPNELRNVASNLLENIFWSGTILDRKSALEVAGIVSEPVLLRMIINAFNSKSRWLKSIAYRQISKLSTISESLASHINKQIVQIARKRQLWAQRYEIRAHVNRLSNSKNFFHTIDLMLWAYPIDIALLSIAIILLLRSSISSHFIYTSLVSASLIFVFALRWFIKFEEWLVLPSCILPLIGIYSAVIEYQWWSLPLLYVGTWGWGAVRGRGKWRRKAEKNGGAVDMWITLRCAAG